jgi:hypothetical protein
MTQTRSQLLSLMVVLIPGVLVAGPPILMLEDGGIQFPDGTILESAAAIDPPETVTVAVDCTSGDTVGDALETPAEALTIQISGFCNENVVIERSYVTLAGGDKALDGIHGVATGGAFEPPVVRILRSSYVTLENLTIGDGPRQGVHADYSRVNINHCDITGNANLGLVATETSRIHTYDLTVSGNSGGGVYLGRGSTLAFDTGEISGNGTGKQAVLSTGASWGYFTDSTISGDKGVEVFMSGFAYLEDTSVTATGVAISAFEQGDINVYGRDGAVQISGAIQADWKAFIWAFNLNQTDATVGNKLSRDSTLKLDSSTILGLALEIFANGDALDSDVGDVTCDSGADLYCHGATSTVNSSTCSLCAATP